MDVAYLFGNFLMSVPKILLNGLVSAIKAVGKFIYDTITWPFRKIWEGLVWAGNKTKEIWVSLSLFS